MRMTVKKEEKRNAANQSGLVALVLAFILLAGTVPVKVWAAESKEDVYSYGIMVILTIVD